MIQAGAARKELLVVAVEASADLHAAAVLRELRAIAPEVNTFGSAGPLMRAEGCEALVRAETLGVMGLVEVLPALPRLLAALSMLVNAARARRPAAALLIDSPDFNLRLAKKLRALGVPAAYFIGPSVWAWRTYRVKQIARDIARMLVILPFEEKFYAAHGVAARYVGNPLADRLRPGGESGNREIGESGTAASEAALPDRPISRSPDLPSRAALGFDPSRPLLALLPGSRRQELARLWRPMLEAARLLIARVPGLQLAVPVAPGIDDLVLREEAQHPELAIRYLRGQAPALLEAADAAIVASGTATLEAALALCPHALVYRMNSLSFAIGKRLVRVQHIGLPNLLAGTRIVPELLQDACTPEAIARALEPLLTETPERARMVEALRNVRAQVAPPGAPNVARQVALEVAALLGLAAKP